MFSRKKDYQSLLKDGVPKVISYVHNPLDELIIVFHKPSEIESHDQRDIYDNKGKVEKIDTSKTYISAFDL